MKLKTERQAIMNGMSMWHFLMMSGAEYKYKYPRYEQDEVDTWTGECALCQFFRGCCGNCCMLKGYAPKSMIILHCHDEFYEWDDAETKQERQLHAKKIYEIQRDYYLKKWGFGND